jgi:hypothetical protein
VYDATGAVVPGSMIVGFGYVQWTWNQSSGILTVTKGALGPQPVGYGNVSGAYVTGLRRDTNDFTDLFSVHATFGSPLYAAVLVNHYVGPNQSNP